jgi:hypothetical protein
MFWNHFPLLLFFFNQEDAFYEDVVLVIFDSVAPIILPVLGGPKTKGNISKFLWS